MSGSLVLTEENRILLLRLADKSVETLCSFSDKVRYAVPVQGVDSFLIVSGDFSSKVMTLTMFRPSEARETLLHSYNKIGLPVLSPEGSEVAWVAESDGGNTTLYVAPITGLDKPQGLPGEFVIDNTGPTWSSDAGGRCVLILALSNGQIAQVHFPSKQIDEICQGELPASLPSGEGFVYWRDRGLWLNKQGQEEKTRLLNIAYINSYYRACQVSPDGRYVVLRTLAPMQHETRRHYNKSIPTLLMIDLQTRKKEVLDQHSRWHGPWAWLAE